MCWPLFTFIYSWICKLCSIITPMYFIFRAMTKNLLDCCIQTALNSNKDIYHNITAIHLAVKPCFLTNQSFTDVLLYVMREYKPVENCNSERVTDYKCVDKKSQYTPVLISLWVIIMLLATIGNSLVCYVIYHTRGLRKLKTYVFIASLAVSDLMIGIFLVPIRIHSTVQTGGFCLSRVLCHFYLTMDNICFVASITNLLVITTDRFIAIDWPYMYQDIMTKTRCRIAIIVVWVYAVIMGGLANVKWEEQPGDRYDNICWTQNKGYITYVFTTVFYIPASIMGIAQARMLIIALKHSKGIATAIPIQDLSKDSTEEERRSSKGQVKVFSRIKKMIREYHAVKMVTVVYGTFVACWIPVSVIALLNVWCPKCTTFKQWQIVVFVEFLPILNSTMNFFIYSVMNREFRRAFRKLFRRAYTWCKNEMGWTSCERRLLCSKN